MNNLQAIQENETYKQVLKDSMGGIMYNVANYGKYDTKELLRAWDGLTPQQQNAADGIMKGAISFAKGN